MNDPKRVSFEEFKLFYDSAERVTDRRLELIRWNYSITAAILVAVGFILHWSLEHREVFKLGLLAAGSLSIMAILFCRYWVGQVRDYKNLNTAKFAVLQQMAPLVEFSAEHAGFLQSFQPFEREWQIMKDMKGLKALGNTEIRILRGSYFELFLPFAFQVIFTGLILLVVGLAVFPPPESSATPPPAATAPAPTPPTAILPTAIPPAPKSP